MIRLTVSWDECNEFANPSFALADTPSEILDAVANFNDSTVSSYSLDAELVTGSLKDLTDITVEQFLNINAAI